MIGLIKEECLLRKLHPLSTIVIILVYLLTLLALNNVVYIGIVIFSILFLAKINDVFSQLCSFIKSSYFFILVVIVFNFILNHNGKTILFYIFDKPFTLESLYYGFFMSLRMFAVIILFGFANLIIDADEAFDYFSLYIGKSALLMSMMFRLTPRLIQLFNQIKEIEILRGNSLEGNFIQKFKGYSHIINILFMTSLEESVEIAESMYSRGFGNRKRTSFAAKGLYFYDYYLLIISFFEIILLLFFMLLGFNKYSFYPKFINPISDLKLFGLILSFSFFIYSIINWWWINGSSKTE